MLHEDDFVGILDGAQLEDVVGTFLEACVGHGVRIHAIQVQGHRLVDGDASVTSLSSSSIRATNSTSRSRDASICQMPSSWDFFAHGGHVARVRVQYAILTRDDRDMCLLGVEDVLEPVSQKRSLFARTMIASSVCSSEKSLYLLYPMKRSHVIPFNDGLAAARHVTNLLEDFCHMLHCAVRLVLACALHCMESLVRRKNRCITHDCGHFAHAQS